MIFIILISIVFIAELIITFTIISYLIKLDKKINNTSIFIETTNPKLKDLLTLVRNISEQILELIPMWIDNIKEERDKIILEQAKSLISTILFWSINIKISKRLRKTKIVKAVWKGLTLVQNVIY